MITVTRGELAEANASAVLRAVSAEWDAPTLAMRRLEIAAGPEVAAQCRKLGELPLGSAAITAAGALQAQFLVHVVLRSRTERVTVAVLRQGLRNGLRRVAEWGIESVALPPLGTGAGNLDADEAAGVMVPLIVEHMLASPHPARVQIVVDTEYERDVFEREVRSVEAHASRRQSTALG